MMKKYIYALPSHKKTLRWAGVFFCLTDDLFFKFFHAI